MRKLRHHVGQKIFKTTISCGIWNSRSIGDPGTRMKNARTGKNIANERKCICEVEEEIIKHIV